MRALNADKLTRIAKYLGMFLTIQTFIFLWAATLYRPAFKAGEPSKLFEFALLWTVLAACLFIVPRLLERTGRDWIKWAGGAGLALGGMELLGAGLRHGTFAMNDLLLPLFFILPPLLWGAIRPPAPWTIDD